MSNLSVNLKHLRKKHGLSQQDIADVLQISKTAISKYERELTEPPLNRLKTIAAYFDIPLNILLEGDLTKVNDVDAEYKRTKRPNVIRLNGVKAHAGNAVPSQLHKTGEKEYWPLLSRKSPTGKLWLVMRVTGDSMVPTASPRDFIICSEMDNYKDDMLALIQFEDGTFSFKQIRKVRDSDNSDYGKYRLISHNKNYTDQIVSSDEIVKIYRLHRVLNEKYYS